MLGYTPREQTPPQTRPPQADTPPWEQTPPGADIPPRADTPLSRHAPQADTPLSRHAPLGGDTPPAPSRHAPQASMLGDTVNAQAVRILLECILVLLLVCR